MKENLEIFAHLLLWSVDAACRLCLPGGKDVHNAILSSIKELAKLFSTYHDEVLVHTSCFLPLISKPKTGIKKFQSNCRPLSSRKPP